MTVLVPPPARQLLTDHLGTVVRPWWIWFSQVFESLYRAELDRATFYSFAVFNDRAFFIAERGFIVEAVREVHAVAGSDGGTVTVGIMKCTGTEAPASGTNILSSDLSVKTTANTVQSGSLTATAADRKLAAGDRLSVNFTGTTTGLAGICVTVTLRAV
jgi:hypothetical protein